MKEKNCNIFYSIYCSSTNSKDSEKKVLRIEKERQRGRERRRKKWRGRRRERVGLVGRQSKCGKIFTVSASAEDMSSLYLQFFFW